MDGAAQLKEIAGEVSVCRLCKLCETRKRTVPGEGRASAEVMLIGEALGFFENEYGRPFIGQSGQLLDELLGMARLTRSEVFITNVVKCRPPNNRDPEPDELQACAGYLNRQIEAIQPAIIVTLGRYSLARYLPGERIGQIHGRARPVAGRLIVPMYHPAAALHQPGLRGDLDDDFSRLIDVVELSRRNQNSNKKSSPPLQEPPPHQLDLF